MAKKSKKPKPKKPTPSDDSSIYPNLSEKCYWEYKAYSDGAYYYYIQNGDLDYHVTPNGVSICRKDGTCSLLSIIPEEVFGNEKMLTDSQLCFILSLPPMGLTHSKEQMESFYQLFQTEKETPDNG